MNERAVADLNPAERIDQLRNKQREKRQSERVARELDVERISREREKKRSEMRELMPKVAAFVDVLKADFGENQVRVLCAEEGGKVVKARGFRG